MARETFAAWEVPGHLLEFFTPVGGGDGVTARNSHPT